MSDKSTPRSDRFELALLRHAKAQWSGASGDYERTLTITGQHEAERVGEWLHAEQWWPDLVLCSSAQRTRQTLEIISVTIRLSGIPIQYEESLYLADLSTLQRVLHNIPPETHRLLLIGHNPGLEELALYLAEAKLPRTFAGEILATANVLLFELSTGWKVQEGCGAVRAVFRPRRL